MELIHAVSLSHEQKEAIQTLISECNRFGGEKLSFDCQDLIHTFFFEENGKICSVLGVATLTEDVCLCSAFTAPSHRMQGLFERLLQVAVETLPEDSEFLFYANQKSFAAAAVADAIGAELDSREHMMERSAGGSTTLPDSSFRFNSFDPIRLTLKEGETPVLNFSSKKASVSFLCYPSCLYLFGFEVTKEFRGMGYGGAFLQSVLHTLDTKEPSLPITIKGLPIRLQVAGDNPAAIHLYKKTGFRITETLCCYSY